MIPRFVAYAIYEAYFVSAVTSLYAEEEDSGTFIFAESSVIFMNSARVTHFREERRDTSRV